MTEDTPFFAIDGKETDANEPEATTEDSRLLKALARRYPAGRDAQIVARHDIAAHFAVVQISYTPTTGAKQDTELLVYDDGESIFAFGGM